MTRDGDQVKERPGVIFVGSFAPSAKDGTVGGQMFACHSLLDSPLSEVVKWLLIDSTLRSLPQPHMIVRLGYAFRRILLLCWYLVHYPVSAILIFTSWDALSFLEKGLMCLLGRACGRRVVLSIRSEVRLGEAGALLTWFRRLVLSRCSVMMCQSAEAAANLTKLLGAADDRINVIPNWIDVERYRQPEGVAGPRGAQEHRFIYLGWLENAKGIYVLLEAVQMLAAKGHQFHLTMCGGGHEYHRLMSRCAELGLERQIEIRGWVRGEAKLEALWRADTLILPSFSEGLPNALLEAMSSGLAVIATTVGGIPSLIRSRQSGILVRPGDALALASAMEELLLNPQLAREMGRYNTTIGIQPHDVRQAWPQVGRLLGIPEDRISRMASRQENNVRPLVNITR